MTDRRQYEALTPVQIESELRAKYHELDDAQQMLNLARAQYDTAKPTHVGAHAKARTQIKMDARIKGDKLTVQDLDDLTVIATLDEYQALIVAEGMVAAAKGNVTKCLAQIDILRSLGASVREAYRGPH